MTRRKEREAAYLNPNAGLGHLSFDLIVSAKQTLVAALRDRRKPFVRLPTNHYTPNAVAVVVMVAAALDVSMNEAIAMSSVFASTQIREVAIKPTCAKFGAIACGAVGFQRAASELRLLVDVRDEIVHYLPRSESSSYGNVPAWTHALQARGLFIEAPGVDFQFSQKVPSYALAYWAWEVAHQTIELFVGSLPAPAQNVCDYLVGNFHHEICPPHMLHEFDLMHSLELTTFDRATTGG